MEGKAAVLGNADFVMPFTAMGLDAFTVEDPATALETARQIILEHYALVVVAENIAPVVEEVFNETVTSALPCVIVVPFTTESKGYATESLGKLLKIATGVNIIKNKQKIEQGVPNESG